jgi:hypothetical protein
MTAPAFSAGQLFERYSRGGALEQQDFQRLVETEQLRPLPGTNTLSRKPEDDFEVGRLFERFSRNTPGHLTQEEFGSLVRTMAGGMRGNQAPAAQQQRRDHGMSRESLLPTSYASTMASANSATGSVVNSDPPTLPRALGELRNGGGYGGQRNRLGAGGGRATQGRGLPLASTELHILSMNMMSKRDQLVQQMRHVQGRTEEVQSVRRAIERETIADTEAILHRLRSVEAFKLSLLNHDMTQLQHDIDEIDAFSDEMQGVDNGVTTSASGPRQSTFTDPAAGVVTARGRYLETCAEAERIINKPFKATTAVHADDYDREVADRLSMAREYDGMQDVLEEKDSMILKLMEEQKMGEERQNELTQKIEDFSRRSRTEMEEWVKLCKHLKKQLADAKSGAIRGVDVVLDDAGSSTRNAVGDRRRRE